MNKRVILKPAFGWGRLDPKKISEAIGDLTEVVERLEREYGDDYEMPPGLVPRAKQLRSSTANNRKCGTQSSG